MEIDENKRRRRGRKKLAPLDNRTHTISTRLNSVELAELDKKCAMYGMQRGEFLRTASLHKLPDMIPEVNQAQWVKLARSAANLNQIAHHLNASYEVGIDDIREALASFRNALVGIYDERDAEDQ